MGHILEEILAGYAGARKQSWDKAGRRTGIYTDFFQDMIPDGGIDPLQNIKKRELSLNDEKYTIDYEYNDLSNLICEKAGIEHSYTYDSLGNRLKKDAASYKINDLNQLVEAGRAAYTFDSNGNIDTKKFDGKTWIIQHNSLNQLVSIKDSDRVNIAFTYDLNGKRLSKKIEGKGKKSRVLRYFYIGQTEIGCLDEKGAITELKVPSNPNNPEASTCIAFEIKNETYVPIYDLQDNVSCLVDPQRRQILESYQYSAFGEEEITNGRGRSISDSSVGNSWRYRGKRIDKDVGLIYFGLRYYVPEIGRWISQDPAGEIDGPNLYSFCHNNPLTYVDYFGLAAETNGNQVDEGYFYGEYEPHCYCERHRDCKRGGDVASALAGISHGVVDFFMGSLHDLQTTSVYMGAGDIDMLLQERMQIIEAIEQSQANRVVQVEGWVMDMLSIDESDAIYQSFRSKTTIGLEVGSLVVGGYGAVKGVMAFNKLAKMPVQISKIVHKTGKSGFHKLDNAMKSIESFLGGKGKVITNTDGDIILIRGNRKIRFDIKDPHGDKPHFHLEKQTLNRKWIDAAPEHRYYFTEE